MSSLLSRIDFGGCPIEGQGTRQVKTPKRRQCTVIVRVSAASARHTECKRLSYSCDTEAARRAAVTAITRYHSAIRNQQSAIGPAMSPETRPEDLPLHDDVRLLASTLGAVIRRLEGEEAFQAVEGLRRACRARRRGQPDAPSLDELLARVDELPLDHAATVARAFTLFFLLINTAEQVHRVRRRDAYLEKENAEPQPGSSQWVMRRLRADGRTAEEVAQAMRALDVRPVLTAHPTESTRRTLLALQARVADLLLAHERAPEWRQREIVQELEAEIELLWLTAEVRQDRPSVMDEVGNTLWYLEDRLVHAASRVRRKRCARSSRSSGNSSMSSCRCELDPGWAAIATGIPTSLPTSRSPPRDARRTPSWPCTVMTLEALVDRLSLSDLLAPAPKALLDSLERDREELPDVWAREPQAQQARAGTAQAVVHRRTARSDEASDRGARRGRHHVRAGRVSKRRATRAGSAPRARRAR